MEVELEVGIPEVVSAVVVHRNLQGRHSARPERRLVGRHRRLDEPFEVERVEVADRMTEACVAARGNHVSRDCTCDNDGHAYQKELHFVPPKDESLREIKPRGTVLREELLQHPTPRDEGILP